MNNLNIKVEDDNLKNLYLNHQHYNPGDSGIDLYLPEDIEIYPGETKYIDLMISCEMLEMGKYVSYYLYPRSSLSKTPLILANHVGIIDAGYRGKIIAAVKYIPSLMDIYEFCKDGSCLESEKDFRQKLTSYKIKSGTRLFQICSRDLRPINKINIVDNLSESKRGSGGFGSTGS